MNAKTIATNVSTLAATSLILLAAFSFTGHAQPQPIEKTQTSPGQVADQQKIDEASSTTAPNISTTPGADRGGCNFRFKTPVEFGRPYLPDFGADSPITIDAGAFAMD